jgi:hypothetical protein
MSGPSRRATIFRALVAAAAVAGGAACSAGSAAPDVPAVVYHSPG